MSLIDTYLQLSNILPTVYNSLIDTKNINNTLLNYTTPSFVVPTIDNNSVNTMLSSSLHNSVFNGMKIDINNIFSSSNYLWNSLNTMKNLMRKNYEAVDKKVNILRDNIYAKKYMNIFSLFNNVTKIDYHSNNINSNCNIDLDNNIITLPIDDNFEYNDRIQSVNIDAKRGSTSNLFYKLRAPMLAFDKSKETYWSEYILSDEIINVDTKPNNGDLIDRININDNLNYSCGALSLLSIFFKTDTNYINSISLEPYTEYPIRLLRVYGITSNKPWQSIISNNNSVNSNVTEITLQDNNDTDSGSLYYKNGKYSNPIKVCDITYLNSKFNIITMENVINFDEGDIISFYYITNDEVYINIETIKFSDSEETIYLDECYITTYDTDNIIIKGNLTYEEYIYNKNNIYFNEPLYCKGLLFVIGQDHYSKDIYRINKNRFGYNNLLDNIINNHGSTYDYRDEVNVYYNSYDNSIDSSYKFMEQSTRNPNVNTDNSISLINSSNITDMLLYSSSYVYKTYSYIYGMYDITINGNIYKNAGTFISKEINIPDTCSIGIVTDDFIPMENDIPSGTLEYYINYNNTDIPICPYNEEYIYEIANSTRNLKFQYIETPIELNYNGNTIYKYKPIADEKVLYINTNTTNSNVGNKYITQVFYGTNNNNEIQLDGNIYIDSSQISDTYNPNGLFSINYVPVSISITGPPITYYLNKSKLSTDTIIQDTSQGTNLDTQLYLYNNTNYIDSLKSSISSFDSKNNPVIQYLTFNNKIIFNKYFNSNYKITVKYIAVDNDIQVKCMLRTFNNNISPIISNLFLMSQNNDDNYKLSSTIGACWGSIKTQSLNSNIVNVKTVNDDGITSSIKSYKWKWQKFTNCGNVTDAFFIYINSIHTTVYHSLNGSTDIPLKSNGEPNSSYLGKSYNMFKRIDMNTLSINNNDDNIYNIGVLLKPGESIVLGMRFLLTKGSNIIDYPNGLCDKNGKPYNEQSYSVDVVSAHPYDYTLDASWTGELEMAHKMIPLYNTGLPYNEGYLYNTPYVLRDMNEPSPYAILCPFPTEDIVTQLG